jgi:hypothetical protein
LPLELKKEKYKMPGLTEQLRDAINNQSCPSPGINNNLGDWVLLSRVPIPPVSETCDENDTSSFNVNGNLDYSGNVDYTRGDPEFEQISLEELLNQNPQMSPSITNAQGPNGGGPGEVADIEYDLPLAKHVEAMAQEKRERLNEMVKELHKNRLNYKICLQTGRVKETAKFIVNGVAHEFFTDAQDAAADLQTDQFDNWLEEFEEDNQDAFEAAATASVTVTKHSTAILPEVVEFNHGNYSLGFAPTLALSITETSTAGRGRSTIAIDTQNVGSDNPGEEENVRGGGGGGTQGVLFNGHFTPGPRSNGGPSAPVRDIDWRIGVQMRATYERGDFSFDSYITYDPYGNHSFMALCTWMY